MGKDRRPHGNRGGFKRGGFNRGGFGRGRGRGGFRGNWGNQDRINNEPRPRLPAKDSPGKRLLEEEVGVTEYMSEHQGFNGIIKSRFSDFQVAEVNEQGEVATLTDLEPPEPEAEEITEDEDLLLNKYNVEILPMDTWDRINKVSLGDDPNVQSVEIDVTTTSKEDRTKIHDAVKKAFGDSIVGSTINADNVKTIQFVKYKKGVRIDRRVKWCWGGEFVHFTLHKEHCDTMEAAARLAHCLRGLIMKASQLGYAGTKDRRAKTCQFFSVRRVDPRRLAAAARRLDNIALGNYCFKDYGLKLGMLRGNQFRIALRNVSAPDAAVAAACERLGHEGFLNYYGLQRFGTRHHTPTHHVGRALLRGDYKEAIDLILTPCEGPLYTALSTRLTRGAHAALQCLPRHCSAAEARLLAALAASPADLLAALFTVPRNTRLLYLHSYQSWVWNRAVSARIRRLGRAPAAGDLVPLTAQLHEEDPDGLESDEENEETPDTNERTEQKTTENKTIKNAESPATVARVKVLTQEDVDGGTYSIFDVVMPLPGHAVRCPPNMRDYYETLLKEDGLTLTLKNKNKSFSMSGAYRRIAIKPSHMTWSSVRYTDPYGDLQLSDLDRIKGRELTAIIPDGIYKAVLLSFTLPSSCYATMALRELLRADTSAGNQALQNNYHKRPLADDDTTPPEKRLKQDTGNTGEDGTLGSGEDGRLRSGEDGKSGGGEVGKLGGGEVGNLGGGEDGKLGGGEVGKTDSDSGELEIVEGDSEIMEENDK